MSGAKIKKNAEFFLLLHTRSLKGTLIFLLIFKSVYGEEESFDCNTRDGAIYGAL